MHWFLILSQPRGLLDEGEASETHGGRLSGHFEDDDTQELMFFLKNLKSYLLLN